MNPDILKILIAQITPACIPARRYRIARLCDQLSSVMVNL